MSDEAIPTWGELLKQRVVELERRFGEFETATSSAAEKISDESTKTSITAKTDDGEREKRRRELAELEREIQSTQTRLDQARQEIGTAEQQSASERQHAQETRAALDDRAAVIQAEADKLEVTRRVIERIWPRFLLTEPFGKWKTDIEKALLEEAPSSSAALLFANLHGYTACLLESDLKYLRDVLRDISRFLYAWIKENGQEEHAAFETALAWAAAFNEECAGRCEIEVPEPGTPANNLSMTFPPRGSSADVASVRTWCVRDAQKRVIHRAEVFT